jgi:hypothetical protein
MTNGNRRNGNGARLAIGLVQWGLPLIVAALAIYITLQLQIISTRYDERFTAFSNRVSRNEGLIEQNTGHRADTDLHMPANVKFGLFATKDALRLLQTHMDEKDDLRHEEVIRRLNVIEDKQDIIRGRNE